MMAEEVFAETENRLTASLALYFTTLPLILLRWNYCVGGLRVPPTQRNESSHLEKQQDVRAVKQLIIKKVVATIDSNRKVHWNTEQCKTKVCKRKRRPEQFKRR